MPSRSSPLNFALIYALYIPSPHPTTHVLRRPPPFVAKPSLAHAPPLPSDPPPPQDEDTFSRDDVIGVANFSLAKARETGSDRVQVPVASKKSKKQHGFLAVTLKWTPNTANKAQAAAAAPAVHHALPPQPYPYAPYPAYYAAPPPPAAYYAPPPAAYYPPPQAYYAAPPPPAAPAQRA